MKKKLFIFGTLLFMATFIGFNININSEEGDGFALLLANVEALANGESMSEDELEKLGCKATCEWDGCLLPNGQIMRYALPLDRP